MYHVKQERRVNNLQKRQRNRFERLNFLMLQTEKWLGVNNERRVVAAFNEEYPWENKIPWLKEVRKATPEEDSKGIDVVFATDVGDIGLQVKSSENARERFVNRQVDGEIDPNIIPVFVSPSYTAGDICRIVMPLIAVERKRRMAGSLRHC